MNVAILGGGQLGRMLALAGYPLGLRFRFLDPNPDSPAGHLAPLVVAPYNDPDALAELAAGAVLHLLAKPDISDRSRHGPAVQPAFAQVIRGATGEHVHHHQIFLATTDGDHRLFVASHRQILKKPAFGAGVKRRLP